MYCHTYSSDIILWWFVIWDTNQRLHVDLYIHAYGAILMLMRHTSEMVTCGYLWAFLAQGNVVTCWNSIVCYLHILYFVFMSISLRKVVLRFRLLLVHPVVYYKVAQLNMFTKCKAIVERQQLYYYKFIILDVLYFAMAISLPFLNY